MTRTRSLLVPFALVAMGTLALCFSGCRKEENQASAPSSSSAPSSEPPANSPASYMNDPAFRKQLSDKRKQLESIVAERAPLVKRMEELVKANNSDLESLKKIPEWNVLHKKVVDLNARYEAVRRYQLDIFAKRTNPDGAAKSGTAGKVAASAAVKQISK